ncbi:MAG TPA: biotin--[acetyl-CoA-carboxylase] ligase, partial [Gemmatimonadaceae bacterium]|nr:biotin--[acetyl-CoA-carboxylase] ligase [Gemmatimonadaceae bacterium]
MARPMGEAWCWHPPEAGEELARLLDLPRVAWLAEVPSTMDVADRLARDGAPGGTLVLADTQTSGRGRGGRAWASPAGGGIWMTLIERPLDASGLGVLSLRVGMRAAAALDRFAGTRVALKWPNDLMLQEGKLGGILVEARWREQRPEWVSIGIGLNLVQPPVAGGAALPAGARREEVLGDLLPALRGAAAASGPLTAHELASYASRDWAYGRRVTSPQAGIVAGLSAAGMLLIETPDGIVACRSGSLVLEG